MARPREFDEKTVLEAARDQFWATGFSGTSMDAVAAATGLGKGSLYGAFGGKRELFHRVFDDYCAEAVNGVRRQLGGSDKQALARLTAYLHGVASASAAPGRRGCLLAKGTAELAAHDPVVAARSRRTLDGMQRLFADAIEACQRHGDLDPSADPQQLAALLVAVHRGIEALGKAGTDESTLRTIAATALAGLPRPQ